MQPSDVATVRNLLDRIPDSVTIVEVGPRDGLQNEKTTLSFETKVDFVEGLIQAGLKTIEIGSFVSPRWVPQMANTAQVMELIGTPQGIDLPALVPNLTGLALAKAAGARTIAIFAAATEGFSRANLNSSRVESFARFTDVASAARDSGMRIRGYVSCAVHCPYEGWVAPDVAARVAEQLMELGCYEVSMCDTTGASTPDRAAAMAQAAIDAISHECVSVHFHDTYGRALANTLVCLQLGVCTVDSSVSGLGGCPYSPGAAGNLATEDLVHMLNGMGVATGVDLARLAAVGREISGTLGRTTSSRIATLLEHAAALEVPVPSVN